MLNKIMLIMLSMVVMGCSSGVNNNANYGNVKITPKEMKDEFDKHNYVGSENEAAVLICSKKEKEYFKIKCDFLEMYIKTNGASIIKKYRIKDVENRNITEIEKTYKDGIESITKTYSDGKEGYAFVINEKNGLLNYTYDREEIIEEVEHKYLDTYDKIIGEVKSETKIESTFVRGHHNINTVGLDGILIFVKK